MDRYRGAGAALITGGLALFSVLLVRGSLRHPVTAADVTTPIEYGAIAMSLALATIGILLVLRSYMVE